MTCGGSPGKENPAHLQNLHLADFSQRIFSGLRDIQQLRLAVLAERVIRIDGLQQPFETRWVTPP